MRSGGSHHPRSPAATGPDHERNTQSACAHRCRGREEESAAAEIDPEAAPLSGQPAAIACRSSSPMRSRLGSTLIEGDMVAERCTLRKYLPLAAAGLER